MSLEHTDVEGMRRGHGIALVWNVAAQDVGAGHVTMYQGVRGAWRLVPMHIAKVGESSGRSLTVVPAGMQTNRNIVVSLHETSTPATDCAGRLQ
jgi:hypothetical protein